MSISFIQVNNYSIQWRWPRTFKHSSLAANSKVAWYMSHVSRRRRKVTAGESWKHFYFSYPFYYGLWCCRRVIAIVGNFSTNVTGDASLWLYGNKTLSLINVTFSFFPMSNILKGIILYEKWHNWLTVLVQAYAKTWLLLEMWIMPHL